MSYSNLTSEYVPASTSNYTQGRRGYGICKITPHHMAGKLTGRRCAELFQNDNRQASANYCIGYEGEIVCSVDEENRAWTSCSSSNDCQAITIEVSNNENCEPWGISDASWNSLVNLCVDICRRYGFRLEYDGTPNGSLTRHDMFTATNCPGQTLGGRFPELVQTVNSILDGGQPEPQPMPAPTKSVDELAQEVINGEWGNGQERKDRLTEAGYDYEEVQKRVNEILAGDTPQPDYDIDELARQVIRGEWGNGQERKDRLTEAGYNYDEIQDIVNDKLGYNSQITYTVQPEDTLSEIAEKYGTTYQELAEKNGIENPNLIFPGQVIVI